MDLFDHLRQSSSVQIHQYSVLDREGHLETRALVLMLSDLGSDYLEDEHLTLITGGSDNILLIKTLRRLGVGTGWTLKVGEHLLGKPMRILEHFS